MIDEHVQPVTFIPPLHTLPGDVRKSLSQLLEIFKLQIAQHETIIGTIKCKLTQATHNLSHRGHTITMKHYKWVRIEIYKFLDAQVVCSSHSSLSPPIIVVPMGDGGKCPVIDNRALSKVTWKFVGPMPRDEDIFSKLNGAKNFSTLNLLMKTVPKTALTSPFGKYKYLKVPFGLPQAPAYL